MGEDTKIQWCHHTFNPWMGCTRVSPACDACYADAGSKRFAAQHKLKLWDDGSVRHITSDAYWKQPLAWDRKAGRENVRRRVFCASFADVFEDREELRKPRERLAQLIERTPNLDWMLLTKRPENMIRFAEPFWPRTWPLNVWAGTTVEDQKRADERLPRLLDVPACIRFVSVEPLLHVVDLRAYLGGLSLVIVGGESGPHARPFDIECARIIREQCAETKTSFFMKQFGSKPIRHWPRQAFPFEPTKWHAQAMDILRLKDPKGGDMSEWPVDLRVRQMPEVRA